MNSSAQQKPEEMLECNTLTGRKSIRLWCVDRVVDGVLTQHEKNHTWDQVQQFDTAGTPYYIYCFKFCCILNWVYSNMSCVNKSAAAAAWQMLGMLASFSCGFWDGGFVSISCSISYKHCGSQDGVAQLFSVLLGDCTSDHWQPVITVV